MGKKKSFWGIFFKILVLIILGIVILIGISMLVLYNSHKKKLADEKKYLVPPGQMVEVDGKNIHVINQQAEEAEHTLVFLHSHKVTDDSIALQPLFEKLDKYNVIYVDRSGTGFSENGDIAKDIDSILDETRKTVKAVNNDEKYVLVASKNAGILAMYWAHMYPDEVEAIVGLQMFFPEQYVELEDDEYNTTSNKLMVKLVEIGAHRNVSNIYPTNDFSVYTDEQMAMRNAILAKGLYTQGIYNEECEIVKNGKKVAELGWIPDIKMYMIYGNPFMDPYLHEDPNTFSIYEEVAKQGEEYDCEASYNAYYKEYLTQYENVELIEISGPERPATYNPDKVAELITNFVDSLE